MKKEHILRRLTGVVATLFTAAFVTVSLPGMINEVYAYDINNKAITGLGAGAISNPDPQKPGSWCYVYYGRGGANGTIGEYRVLQKDTTEFSREDENGEKIKPYTHTMFLDSDDLFEKMKYCDSEEKTGWKESNPYKWLNEDKDGFYKSATYLTDAEKAAIVESYKKQAKSKRSDFRSLTGEKVFIPDLSDVICSDYGYYSNQSEHDCRKKKYSVMEDSADWWLRTNSEGFTNYAKANGNSYGVCFEPVWTQAGVSPAFNLDLSSVLFSSVVFGEEGAVGAEYELTIKDKNLGITAGDVVNDDNTVTVPYQVSENRVVSGNSVNRISVLLIDREYKPGETVLCTPNESGFPQVTYLKLDTDESFKSGTGTFSLPDEYTNLTCGEDYHAYLVAERLCGKQYTDYASEPVEFNIPNATVDTCDHEFEYTVNGDSITASCKKEGCRYHEKGIRVGMKLPEDPVYEPGIAREASVTGYPGRVITNLAERPEISYYRSTGFGSTEQEDTTAVTPDTPGEYVAVMTWGGRSVKKAFSVIDVEEQGNAGANTRWYLSKDGILTIAGTGSVWDYSSVKTTPWYNVRTKIVGIHILKGVTRIGKYAFADLENNESIILPEGLKSIGEYAFRYSIPKTITIPKSVSFIGEGAFLCNTIREINVEEGSENYKIEDGVLLTKDGKELLKYPSATAAASYTVPDTVEKIAYGAFAGSPNLKSIELPVGLKRIEGYAFWACAIDNLDIPDGVEYIGACVFGRSALREVIIPNSAALDSYAFYYADKPEKIYYVGTESEWNSFNLQGILDITSVQCDYRIDITSFTIDEIPIQKYEGKPVTPKVTLRNPLTGKVLIENTDYIVEYFENTDWGRAEIVVTGKADLPGSKSRYEGRLYGSFLIAEKVVRANVIFRVVNGSWDDGTKDDKTAIISTAEGNPFKLLEGDIPKVGNNPDEGYVPGSWNKKVEKGTVITEGEILIYTYAGPLVEPETVSPMNPVMIIDDNTTEIHLVKGQKFTLPEGGWTSSNKKFVKIAKKTGLLTAKKETKDGSVTITKTGSDKPIKVYITTPKLEKKKIMNAGAGPESLQLDHDRDHLKVQWYSDSPDVATVSGNGIVTPVSKGKAVITAYINGKAYTGKVIVKETQPAAFRTLHLNTGSSKTLKVKGVKSWSTADESIAGADKLKIKGLKAGETTLSGTDKDGKTFIVAVTVEDIGVKTEKLLPAGKNKYKVELKPGEKTKIEFNAVKQPVIFKSSNGDKAYADRELNIVANHEGKAKLTAKLNGKTVSVRVVVKK